MHSSEVPPPQAVGADLLRQLGRLIIRARSPAPDKRRARPSTSQVSSQPRLSPELGAEHQLDSHVQELWDQQTPICVEVYLAPDGAACSRPACDCRLLLERWTMSVMMRKSHQTAPFSTSQWLLNAVRSQLHFSQLSAWIATLNRDEGTDTERRRKLSREMCNFKKLESNCDKRDLPISKAEMQSKKLNVHYSITTGDTYQTGFTKTPVDHTFPITDIGNNVFLKTVLQSLPRTEHIPVVKCICAQPKRRLSNASNDDIANRMIDLNLGPPDKSKCKRSHDIDLRELDKVVDDRMHTPCSENGKHKCNCDDESDQGKDKKESTLKELAKYKRRLRKESKLRKLRDSTSESNEEHKSHSSIPILQASRFDRLKAIGCYRNQTYLTLPASRVESRSPFVQDTTPIPEYKKTKTMGTQTDDITCDCGSQVSIKCGNCERKMVRSEANYNLASMTDVKCQCDKNSFNDNYTNCDTLNVKIRKCPDDDAVSNIIKRPKLKRLFSTVNKLEKIVTDRMLNNNDAEELFLKNDDTVFAKAITRTEREKHPSISEDYVVYEKCCYANYDKVETESPKESNENHNGFTFPHTLNSSTGAIDAKIDDTPSIDRRIDSKSAMFNNKTGLPLTSSPAPMKRGSNCFDYDASINDVAGIKSALFPSPCGSPRPRLQDKLNRKTYSRSGLLGSFEECVLKGRVPLRRGAAGFSAALAAAGAFCPPQRRLPADVAFAYTHTNTYRGHIDLSPAYHVPPSGTIQVSLFNPHGTLVKMFVVLYDLTSMPPSTKTFLRQRTLYLPAGSDEPPLECVHKYLRYLIHLRFMTSKSGKLYLHSDIKILVSKRADMDTATAHAAIFKPSANRGRESAPTNRITAQHQPTNHKPCRVFGGCGDLKDVELGHDSGSSVAYELRSFTYGPENPKYSPR